MLFSQLFRPISRKKGWSSLKRIQPIDAVDNLFSLPLIVVIHSLVFSSLSSIITNSSSFFVGSELLPKFDTTQVVEGRWLQTTKQTGVTTTAYKGVKGYWMRKGYEKLDGNGSRRRKRRVVELAAENGSSRRRLFWRIRLTPRLKLKLRLRFSPKKFILRLRDAYINLMTKLASSRFVNSRVAGYPGEGISGFGLRPLKEYDEKMVVEIYKSLVMAQGHQLVNPSIVVVVHPHKIPTLLTVTEC